VSSLIKYGIRYPIIVNVVMVVLCLIGLLSLSNVRYTFFPDIPVNVIEINVVFPGASPEEVEQGITYKIEDNLKGLKGVERILSTSQENRAQVLVELKNGEDADRMLQEVKNEVDKVNTFPQGIEAPIVFKQEQFNFAISYAVSGPVQLSQLKGITDKLEEDLRRTDGVSQVTVTGYPDREIEIALDESLMDRFQLSFSEVSQAVASANIDLTGGTIKAREEEYIIRAREKRYTARELENIVVRSSATGNTIRLRDIAAVTEKWEDLPSRSYLNGAPSAVVMVSATQQEDILEVAGKVKDYMNAFNEQQSIVKATIIRDQTVSLRERIALLTKNGLVGVTFILIFLAMFLHYRLAFWVALGIPISFLSMFILFGMYGMTINVISLFGMIIVIGILVDDGVIVSENIYRHYEEGKDRIEASVNGVFEMIPSIVSAILTTVIIFSIFFFIEGRVGQVFSDIAFVVITTLVVSLIEALFILPAHVAHSKALIRNGGKKGLQKWMDQFIKWLTHRVYAPVLNFIIQFKLASIAFSIALLIFGFGMIQAGWVKTTFFPIVEQDNINIQIELPYGVRENVTKEKLDDIEAAVRRVNEDNKSANNGEDIIINVEQNIGPNTNLGNLNIILQNSKDRNLRSFALTGMIRDEVGVLAGVESMIFATQSPFGKPISISIQGDNLDDLRAVNDQLKAGMASLDEVKDVTDTDVKGKKEIHLKLKDKAYQLGFTLAGIMSQVRSGFYGFEVQNLQVGQDEVKVWVRFDEDYRSNIAAVEQMKIRNARGDFFLNELVEMEIVRGPLSIKHVDGFREIRVESEVANNKVSIPDVVEKIREEILPPILQAYPSVKVSYEGQSRETAKTASSAQRILPILLLLTFAVIALVFRSVSQTFTVLLLIPFSLVGVIFGHWVHGAQIGVLSVLGVIALIGVLVNNALVFISTYNGKLKTGMRFREALFETGLQRFRPILLTSLTTVAGLSPLILEKGFQAQFLIPMAISLAYGLAFATFLTLVLLPSLLVLMNDGKYYAKWLWTGEKPQRESLEAAVREDQFKS
jgi:multidrug efflux pump subunit AcrB